MLGRQPRVRPSISLLAPLKLQEPARWVSYAGPSCALWIARLVTFPDFARSLGWTSSTLDPADSRPALRTPGVWLVDGTESSRRRR